MADIKAADVAKLRKATGAGMMDCKKALQEAEGDFERAVEVIRKKGQAIANKRADREAGEGSVQAKVDGAYGAMISLNCETDFVAKNEDFVKFAVSILDLAVANKPANLEALLALTMDGKVLSEVITDKSGTIGEKLELTYFDFIQAEKVQAPHLVIKNVGLRNYFNKINGFNVILEL